MPLDSDAPENDPFVPRLDSAQIPGLTPEPLLRISYFELPPGRLASTAMPEHSILLPVGTAPVPGRARRGGKWIEVELHPGTMVITPAGTEAEYHWQAPLHAVLLRIVPERMKAFASEDLRLILEGNSLEGRVLLRDAELERDILALKTVVAEPGPGQAVLFESLSRVLLVRLIRTYADCVADSPAPGGLRPATYAAVLDHIDQNLDRALRTGDLARVVGMSESALLKALKASAGETPQSLVRRRRVEAARRFLDQTDDSLGSIAAVTGFADQAHLSRSFKQLHGVTPSAWRRARRP